MNKNTEAYVLASHGIAPMSATDEERTEAARRRGIIGVCLSCGNVASTDLSAYVGEVSREAARQMVKETLLDIDPDLFTCHPDGTTVLY